MELFLLKLVVFLRAIGSMQYAENIFGILGIIMFTILLAAVIITAAMRKKLRFSAVDAMAISFGVWCICVGVIYYEATVFGQVAKVVVPVFSYTIAKNLLSDLRDYRQLLIWTIVGLSIPALISSILISIGDPSASAGVMYWTKVTRWDGAYVNPHNLGHSMTLLLMTLAIFVVVRESTELKKPERRPVENILMALVGAAALYCLYMSQVRTSILGLMIFSCIYLFFYNKKLLVIGTAFITILAVVTLPLWYAALLPELYSQERGANVELTDLASGRPKYWLNDLAVFAGRPIDEQIAGGGIVIGGEGREIEGHNDWLELLTQTGLVGFSLFTALQILIWRAILRMPGNERYALLALFIAVNLMMFMSNSYVWRIQVGHLYYILLAVVELQRVPNGRYEVDLGEQYRAV